MRRSASWRIPQGSFFVATFVTGGQERASKSPTFLSPARCTAFRKEDLTGMEMSEIILKGIPTFRIFDYRKAVDFYIQGLGFSIDWEHRFGPGEPVYMQIFRNGLTLHLSENKRFKASVIIFVDCKELDKFYSELNKKKIKLNFLNQKKPIGKQSKWKSKTLLEIC